MEVFEAFWDREFPQKKKEAQEILLILRAVTFSYHKTGSCSARSSYAAIEFFRMLPKGEYTVCLQSFPEKDHYIVLLGNKSIGLKIYDPLTNPEIIFDILEYKSKVLTLFKDVKNPIFKVQCSMTESLLKLYDEKKFDLEKLIFDSIKTTALSNLLGDRMFIDSMRTYGIKENEIAEITGQALNSLKKDILKSTRPRYQ